MNINDFLQTLPYLVKAKLTPNVIGAHGIGKSSIIKQFAKDNGYSFHPYFLGQMSDAGDILGLQEFDRDETGKAFQTRFIHPEKLPKKKRSLLFFDELNRAHKDLIQAIFQLVLEGEYHNYKLPEDSAIIVAMNPATDDYTVLDFNDKAFQDRFVHINLRPTVQEWSEYVTKSHGRGNIVNFINDNPKMLEKDGGSFDLSFVTPSRRSWERVIELQETGIPDTLLRETLMGLVGTESMATYLSWLESQDKTPTAEEILNNFESVKAKIELYSDKDKLRRDAVNNMSNDVVAFLKDNKPAKDQFNNLIEFIVTLPKEYAFATIVALHKNPNVQGIEGLDDPFHFYNDKRLCEITAGSKELKKKYLGENK